MTDPAPARVLPAIVLAQFAGTSLWFAVNAVMGDLQRELGWPAGAVGTLTSAVQLGFIAGTLVFSLLAVADRYSARRVFLACALAGAGCTIMAWVMVRQFEALLVWRALTGFFLAGIYPVGMKIAAQWYPRGLGAALGMLVGALVLGSAVPHALRAAGAQLPWPSVMIGVAALSAAGGLLLVWLVPEPAHGAARTTGLRWTALGTLATDRRLRASVLGYFGHMWELYTLWVLVPAILATRLAGPALSWASFAVIGIGFVGCVAGGLAVRRAGSARVAGLQLAVSGVCCLAAPWLMHADAGWFAAWLLVWGVTVVGDSPQFSALAARHAPSDRVGSVLTLMNCIGFAVSILSIELFVGLAARHPLENLLPWLAVGPVLGLLALGPLIWERA